MRRWPWNRRDLRSGGPRTSGPPPSANGASSLHLRWDLDGSWRAISIDLTVEEPPAVPSLYFWALQADFVARGGTPAGGAHLGLQWHSGHPGSTAVNWGGYRHGGGELDGSASTLPSAMANPNTRDFPWQPHRTYRLAIVAAEHAPAPSGSTAWRASVADLATGTSTVVRDLYTPGDRIRAAVMWSEVFARCDDPPTTARWSEPSVTDLTGSRQRPQRAIVNYQSHADGGCANTCSWSAPDGLRQRTDTERTIPQGTVLPWPVLG